MTRTLLRGITWNHSRALPPLVAVSQRFEELHPGVEIRWERRSLHEFGHAALATLAKTFDLLVIDHPMAGDAEAGGVLMDLLPLLTPAESKGLEQEFIGPSFASYLYRGKLYALPIDAAAPAASLRPDLLEQRGLDNPRCWSDVLALAARGLVRMPAFSADLFLNFMGLCVSHGAEIAHTPEQLVAHPLGAACLEMLRELAAFMPPDIYAMNPIALYERMASEGTIAYCPFAYTYSNYSRDGFASRQVRFADPVKLDDGRPMRTVLGGTGLAISSGCGNSAIAWEFIRFVSSATCQRTLYGMAGGQPAHRCAWNDAQLNAVSDAFFLRTTRSLETAYMRPRYPGYAPLQERSGALLAGYCRDGGNVQHTLRQLDALYRDSLPGGL